MNPHWYRTFFDEHALDSWQQSRSDEDTAAEVECLEALLAVDGGGHLLDIACGDGRHAVGLGARGYAVTGIDIAEGNRERVASRMADTGVSMELVIGDATELDYHQTFDGAYMWGNSFGYFPPSTTAIFLDAVARALKPGARFIIDTAMTAESILVDLSRKSWYRLSDELSVLLDSTYIPVDSRLDTVYTTIKSDRVVGRGTAHIWVYSCRELVDMGTAAGLRLLDLHGDLDGSPYELGDDQLIITFERMAS